MDERIWRALWLFHIITESKACISVQEFLLSVSTPFSDWFRTKRTFVWFQINRKMVNTIWFRVALIRFQKDFSVCIPIERYYLFCAFSINLSQYVWYLNMRTGPKITGFYISNSFSFDSNCVPSGKKLGCRNFCFTTHFLS